MPGVIAGCLIPAKHEPSDDALTGAYTVGSFCEVLAAVCPAREPNPDRARCKAENMGVGDKISVHAGTKDVDPRIWGYGT